jgi:hypothetical protein
VTLTDDRFADPETGTQLVFFVDQTAFREMPGHDTPPKLAAHLRCKTGRHTRGIFQIIVQKFTHEAF